MKIKLIKIIKPILISTFLLITGCTEQSNARNFGGTTTIAIPAGQKVIGATWKDNDLWILYRPIHENEKPEIVTLAESSSYGIWEGKVIIKELSIESK